MYSKVASSIPVYYSILEPFGQRLNYRGVTEGGARGAVAPPPFVRIEGVAGSGGASP